jgi:hypothetical protein
MSHGLYLPKAPPPNLIDELQAWSLVLPPTAAFTHSPPLSSMDGGYPKHLRAQSSRRGARTIPGRDEVAFTSAAIRSPIP